MKQYVVVKLNVKDDSWVPEYLEAVTKMVHEHGGHYLARTTHIEKIEGDGAPWQMMVILEFPSEEAARGFYGSDAYKPFLEKRLAGSDNETYLVAGEDIAAG